MLEKFSKAEILDKLSKFTKTKRNKTFEIPQFCFFSKKEFLNNSTSVLKKIKKKFKGKQLIIRSSSFDEDGSKKTNAGKYKSFSNVNSNQDFEKLIKEIISEFKSSDDQFIVQTYINKPDICGVVFSRDPSNNSPYYIINYDQSGKTDIVTSGKKTSKTFTKIVQRSKTNNEKKFKQLLKIVNILELFFNSSALDIEFGYKNKKWFVFQCRLLPIKSNKIDNDKAIEKILLNLEKKIEKIKLLNPTIEGSTTVFSNMSDWNPAEMIGDKPKPLAISLYKKLITDDVWSKQRSNYGYKDVSPNPLLFNFAGSPYIDLRTDFNSFLPKGLNLKTEKKLINFFLKEIIKKPERHDKIEFDLIPTIFEIGLDKRRFNFLTNKESKNYFESLRKMTNQMIKKFDLFVKSEIKNINLLEIELNKIESSNLSHIQKIYFIIDICKKLGTLSFAGVARLAFLYTNYLKSLEKYKAIDHTDVSDFYKSINTYTNDFFKDLFRLKNKKVSKNIFLLKYGHIRPSTYSITSLNYRDGFSFYFANIKNKKNIKHKKFLINSKKKSKIDKIFLKNSIKLNSNTFFKNARTAIKLREDFKFKFTKAIDLLFKYISNLGNEIQISKDDLAFLSIDVLLNSYSNLDGQKLYLILKNEIKKNKKYHKYLEQIKLPDFINKKEEIYTYYNMKTSANYVTKKIALGNVYQISDEKFNKENLDNKIILIENADPGYDFIFAYKIKGLITKYGGANSHMSIRCLELNIPAVIGIGEEKFNGLLLKNYVEIDCNQKKVNF